MSFRELSKEKQSEFEKKLSEKWQKDNLLQKTIDNRNDYFVFYDGPATANPMPLIRYIKSIYSNFLLNQGITG